MDNNKQTQPPFNQQLPPTTTTAPTHTSYVILRRARLQLDGKGGTGRFESAAQSETSRQARQALAADWLRYFFLASGLCRIKKTMADEVSEVDVQDMEVDRRRESDESADEEIKEKPDIPDGGEKNGEEITGDLETPVDIETINLDPDAEDVDLNHLRIGKIQGFEVLRKVKTLCLRQNLIKLIENLELLTTLTELDLYDNQIRKIQNLDNLSQLEILDLSFNLLRRIDGLDTLTQLRRLYLVNNKITRIENLVYLTQLRLLELGSNRLRVIENIESLRDLDSLFLGKNKITKLQNLETLTNLTVLSVQSNRLTKIEGLNSLVNLRELYLSDNGIQVLEGLDNNNKLTTLDVASNRIKRIENIRHLTELQEFWMNDNLVENWGDLEELSGALALQTVYLERNPLQKDAQYRRKIMLALPSVRQIDATFVRF
ncbi:phosphatase 1 regulatory subunit 7 [Pelobates cultripes]|uniref:Protein phosphatase 1 regulatory subunit 7 n=2 Tax=Pelobates cultripes TaxID=61616 RepID=A0AAD1RAM4_PELCU|nr:phosphatase 1 regulatory subunit 7 [Pelobates cultripes]